LFGWDVDTPVSSSSLSSEAKSGSDQVLGGDEGVGETFSLVKALVKSSKGRLSFCRKNKSVVANLVCGLKYKKKIENYDYLIKKTEIIYCTETLLLKDKCCTILTVAVFSWLRC